MSLSQTQIIRSLGEALSWFEKELEWGVSPQNLNHLTARIGELYAAMVTRGQMALEVNQRGYDVVSAENERISVKTVTTSNHVLFKRSTFDVVDRVIILRVNTDENEISIEEIIDIPASELIEKCRIKDDGYSFPIRRRQDVRQISKSEQTIVHKASIGDLEVLEYESGTIDILKNGQPVDVVKPVLRELAAELGVSLTNRNGNLRNTRQLGSEVLASINAQKRSLEGNAPA